MVKYTVLSHLTQLYRDDWDSPFDRGLFFIERRYENEQIKKEIPHEHIQREYLEKLRNGITIKVLDLINKVRTIPLDNEESYAMFVFYSMVLGDCLRKINMNDVNETYLAIYWNAPIDWSSDEEEDGYGIKKAIG